MGASETSWATRSLTDLMTRVVHFRVLQSETLSLETPLLFLGQQFDGTGTLDNWWTTADLEACNERAQCFVEQYDAYEVPEISGGNNNVNFSSN